MSKTKNEWDRQEGETSAAFVAFCTYRDLGVDRTLYDASVDYGLEHRGRGKSSPKRTIPGYVSALSRKFRWVARCNAYDDHIHKEKLEQDRRLILAHRKKQLKKELKLIDKITAKASLMLDMPLVEKVSEDGLTIIKPANWRLADMVRMLELANKLSTNSIEPDEQTTKDKEITFKVKYE